MKRFFVSYSWIKDNQSGFGSIMFDAEEEDVCEFYKILYRNIEPKDACDKIIKPTDIIILFFKEIKRVK